VTITPFRDPFFSRLLPYRRIHVDVGCARMERVAIPVATALKTVRRFVFLLSCLALLMALWVAAEAQAQEKSLLWRVRSDHNTIYILGAVHFLKKDGYPLNKAIETAFEAAQKLVFEIDLGASDPLKMQAAMLQRGVYRDGKRLSQTVSEKTYGLASERAKGLGIDLGKLDAFKPWAIAMMLTSAHLQKLGFDPKYGVDRHFFERAQSGNKAVIGLETAEQQFGLFDQMSAQQQELMLLQTLRDLELVESGVQRLLNAWKNGNEKVLEELILGGFRDYPELYQRVMLDRNRQWLSRLEAFLAESEVYMVVVGAGHLVGKGSVIELLRERGYTVEQM
jgi:uncharacterized protein YbaP (TraB family)